MNRAKYLKQENQKWPAVLIPIPRDEWPDLTDRLAPEKQPLEVWRSKTFLVQIYYENGFIRISVMRTDFDSRGKPRDGITWDELQRLKAQCNRGDYWAVECFPPDEKVVNVANMRHIWVLPSPPPYGWGVKPK